jgi:hypothetical protein
MTIRRKEKNDRTHKRIECNMDAIYWHPMENECVDLKIRNISQSGLYFETTERPPLRTDIDILMNQELFCPEVIEDVKVCKTKIKWTKKIRPSAIFGAGAQIVSTNDPIDARFARKLLCTCDLCGRYDMNICEGDECVLLCPECLKSYSKLPPGIKKYLLGNIY